MDAKNWKRATLEPLTVIGANVSCALGGVVSI